MAQETRFPPRLARSLIAAGILPEATDALAFFPSVVVAWADGKIEEGEREAIQRATSAVKFPKPAAEMLETWLLERPENSDELLDLAWQLIERLPIPLQRQALTSAVTHAEAVGRVTGHWRGQVIGKKERRALETVVEALGGRSAETARRRVLSTGMELEERLPGYEVIGPEEATRRSWGANTTSTTEEANATEDHAKRSPLDSVLTLIEDSKSHTRMFQARVSRRRRMTKLIKHAYAGLDAADRELGGLDDRPLESLTPWEICRFLILFVCRRARYDHDASALIELLVEPSLSPDAAQNLLETPGMLEFMTERDRTSTADLLSQLLDGDNSIPLICRDYARIVAEMFGVCRYLNPNLRSAHVIVLSGKSDLRARIGHAWCLFLDTEHHVAVPFDPTSADSLWDGGSHDSPFNVLLDGRGMCTASTLLHRLVWEEDVRAADVTKRWLMSLDEEARRVLGLRVAAQANLIDPEVLSRWFYPTRDRHPELAPFMFALLEREHESEALIKTLAPLLLTSEDPAFAEDTAAEEASLTATGRLFELLCVSGAIDEELLSPDDRGVLEAHRALHSSREAQVAGVGRNDPCPCGSGKKYKRCCMQ